MFEELILYPLLFVFILVSVVIAFPLVKHWIRVRNARNLNDRGSELLKHGILNEALRLDEQALTSWRMIGDRYREAKTLIEIALIHHVSGHESEALERGQQALAIFQTTGTDYDEGHAHLRE